MVLDTDHKKNVNQMLKHAEQVCEAKGEKLTALRRSIFEILVTSPKPLKAYDIVEKLRIFGKKTQATTVYRILDVLTSIGLVHKIEAFNAYIPCTSQHEDNPALLFICSQCLKTAEVEDSEFYNSIKDRLCECDMNLSNNCIEIRCTCKDCKQK